MIDCNATDTNERLGSIDRAIDVCDSYIRKHRSNARLILMTLILISIFIVFISVGAFGVFFSTDSTFSAPFSDVIIWAFLAIFTLVFGVTTSLYRFHLNEISKMEHYKIGFLRIRIAANNISEGFEGEVRKALTESAFTFQPTYSGFGRPKKVDNPLLGHPGVDLTTTILNKLLDGVEVKPKRRGSERN